MSLDLGLVIANGGEIQRQRQCVKVEVKDGRVVRATFRDPTNSAEVAVEGDYFFSTMPVKELIAAMGEVPPPAVREVATGLVYRDFITVGLLVKRMTVAPPGRNLVPDNWIYIQERDVKIGRLQVFNNWSPYMVKDPSTVWLGLEYFCNKGDELWSMTDQNFISFATRELAKIGMIAETDVLDGTLLRMEKTYPAYFGSYERFDVVRRFTDTLPNLFLVGRNGMHRYNNSDHSMLTAMTAVDNIIAGIQSKENIWAVNTEQDYHEERAAAADVKPPTGVRPR